MGRPSLEGRGGLFVGRPSVPVFWRDLGSGEELLPGLSGMFPLAPTLSPEGRGGLVVGRPSLEGRGGWVVGRHSVAVFWLYLGLAMVAVRLGTESAPDSGPANTAGRDPTARNPR